MLTIKNLNYTKKSEMKENTPNPTPKYSALGEHQLQCISTHVDKVEILL